MFRWRLYYEDGSTFDDRDGAPTSSPEWGVVAVVQPGTDGRDVLAGTGDVYVYRTDLDLWHEVGASGLLDHLAHYARWIGCVRPGRWMPRDDEFFALIDRARNEAGI